VSFTYAGPICFLFEQRAGSLGFTETRERVIRKYRIEADMERDILLKIQNLVDRGAQVSEDEVRSLMNLVRKRLELEPEPSRNRYLTLNLFCNWAAHTKITQSITGLKVLGRINDALVRVRRASVDEIQTQMSRAIGFDPLYSEFLLLLRNVGITHKFSDKRVWAVFLAHLIEIIRDVPLAFPPVSKLKKDARKIYDRIVQKPIKPGAGVILIQLSSVDYGALGAKGVGTLMCLLVRTEDTTTTVVPLRIKV